MLSFYPYAVIGAFFMFFSSAALSQQFSHEHTLGTRFSFTIEAVNDKQATQAYGLALNTIAKLENQLSSYRKHSALSELNTHKKILNPSEDLVAVLQLCLTWQQKTQNHFSCRLGSIKPLWQQAELKQTLPERIKLRTQARKLRREEIVVNARHIMIPSDMVLDIDGVAKGYIIDKVHQVIAKAYPHSRFKVDIGGDGKVYGDWTQYLVNPNRRVNEMHYKVNLPSTSYAASGQAYRHYVIKKKTMSHILAPRDGWPVDEPLGSVVLSDSAADADAIATALTTMTAPKALNWLNKNDIAAQLFLTDQRVLTSDAFSTYQTDANKARLSLSYEIPEFDVAEYNKPYLAIWLSDKQGKTVKHLALLGEQERWWEESRKWWRRVGTKEAHVISGLAQATQRPGQYQLSWFGRDDWGNQVIENQLILNIEASREDGGHDFVKIPLDFTNPNTIAKPTRGEIGKLAVTIF